jgi:hypothetical protein
MKPALRLALHYTMVALLRNAAALVFSPQLGCSRLKVGLQLQTADYSTASFNPNYVNYKKQLNQ